MLKFIERMKVKPAVQIESKSQFSLTSGTVNERNSHSLNKSIFDAIDTDNSGTLEREEVESFVKSLLVGIHNDGEEEYDQNERHRIVFGVLDENESGEITLDELGKFLRELFKEQIKELQDASERIKRKNNQNKQGFSHYNGGVE